jgi:hypothetical protein
MATTSFYIFDYLREPCVKFWWFKKK